MRKRIKHLSDKKLFQLKSHFEIHSIMKHLIAIFIGLFSIVSFSQKDIKIIVGLSKSYFEYEWHSEKGKKIGVKDLNINNYQVYLGIQLLKSLNLTTEIGFNSRRNIESGFYYNSSGTNNMKTINLGINIDYRFLPERIISPKISVSGGIFPYSNLKNRKVYFSNLTVEDNTSYFEFNKWNGYSNVQVFLSVKWKQLFFDLGGGFNFIRSTYTDNTPFWGNSQIRHRNGIGWNIDFKIYYAFPLSKSIHPKEIKS